MEFLQAPLWKYLGLFGMVLFFIFGVDLLFGARLMGYLSRMANQKFHVDHLVVNALNELKRNSDREFDVEKSLMHGWGRLVVSGLLFFSAVLIFQAVTR